jgi:hypothetical protein
MLVGDHLGLDTNNSGKGSEMRHEAEEETLHTVAKVHDMLELCQGSQNLYATRRNLALKNNNMSAIEYISGTEAIIQAS